MKQAIAFSLLVGAFFSCEDQSITRQETTPAIDPTVANATPAALGGTIKNGPSLPLPTITEQTYVPANDLFAHTRCRAWRITWPTYPVGTNANLIPTVFSVKSGGLNSFNYLNNTAAANTYKTNFNLYHNTKLETANTLWAELTHAFNAGSKMETTYFNKTKHSAASVETWVKGRPELFKIYWEHEAISPFTEIANYQPGEIYLFRIIDHNTETPDQYGGIRIVSMTPRIIEVYLAEPNE
ncbi:hypothetical protein [Fibrisoma montanum]|nr:hypothetical protein [Fibrisoma montanum]